jgi:hypothetical protein
MSVAGVGSSPETEEGWVGMIKKVAEKVESGPKPYPYARRQR